MLVIHHPDHTIKVTVDKSQSWPDNFNALPQRVRRSIPDRLAVHAYLDNLIKAHEYITLILKPNHPLMFHKPDDKLDYYLPFDD